jgi:hypothetical protein
MNAIKLHHSFSRRRRRHRLLRRRRRRRATSPDAELGGVARRYRDQNSKLAAVLISCGLAVTLLTALISDGPRTIARQVRVTPYRDCRKKGAHYGWPHSAIVPWVMSAARVTRCA